VSAFQTSGDRNERHPSRGPVSLLGTGSTHQPWRAAARRAHMGSGVTHGKRGQVFHYDMVRVIRDKPRLLRNVKNRLKNNTPDPQSAARFVGRVVLIVMRQK
jgi:hypothetical protein